MRKINLEENGSRIKEPSGKKVTASTLEVGKNYLHQNYHFLRTIFNIVGKEVQYKDKFSPFLQPCSTTHFAQICPNEATQEEIAFIKDSES